jgi:hypothetical protein
VSRFLACLVAAVAMSGCGSSPPVGPPPTPTPRPSAKPTPTLPPDVEHVDVLSTGVGSYQLITVPVAVVHNAATRTGVSGLIVHFIPSLRGRPLTPLDSVAVTLYPGETMPVTANCTDTCLNADGVTVTLGAGTWAPLPGSALAVGHASANCVSGCGGHGQWDVTATIGGPELTLQTPVDMFAACFNAAGLIIGGGQRLVFWPQAGGSLTLDVPGILSGPPVTCQVGVSART